MFPRIACLISVGPNICVAACAAARPTARPTARSVACLAVCPVPCAVTRAATPASVPVRFVIALLASITVALLTPTAAARDIRPRFDSVVCTPGGVAAIALERTGLSEWPARIPVKIGALQSQATLVLIAPRADDGLRSWTRAPAQVDVSLITEVPETPEPEKLGGVFAMVELPASGEGSLEIGGVAVTAHWLPAPKRVRADAPVLAVPATISDDRPDPHTPFEFWRWSLIAERQGARIGEPRGRAAEKLWARHVQSLWLGALERVRSSSRGLYDELSDLLAGIVQDPDCARSVAAWIVRPEDLRTLLALLVDHQRTDAETVEAALTWVRGRWTCTMWVEEDCGDQIQLAVANPTSGERILHLSWDDSVGESITSALVLPPHRITRARVDRPPLRPSTDPYSNDRSRNESLQVMDGEARVKLTVGAREYAVRPPALAFGTFMPPLSLADIQSSSIEPVAQEWRTSASLRCREGRWELFVEAFRPHGAPEPELDEVIVRIGNPSDPTRVMRVTGDGALDMKLGADDGVAVGFMAWTDRWRARIELPEAWLPSATPGARPLLLSVERIPGPSQARQTAGLSRPAWLPSAPPILVDLGLWGNLGN